MGKRRAARELALKLLFQVDLTETSISEALESALKASPHDEATVSFACQLSEKILANSGEIDRLISKYTKQWPIDRMANVDRCLLRIAICEILYFGDIPHSVSVDEAVELAKKYSTADSGRFINGVLGSLIKDLAGDAP
jgi:N utilization substance protein B